MHPSDHQRATHVPDDSPRYRDIPPAASQTPAMALGDIYYVLFRHKWKIILCSLAGLAAAFAIYRLRPPPYQSEARLFIRYVTEGKTLTPPGEDTKTISPQRGDTIINSELQILTSLDLARQVALTVGPERILGTAGGENAPIAAAGVVSGGLTVDVPPNSNVIRVAFKHRDPAVVQPVLAAIVDAYLKKHVEIHEAVGIVGDFLTQETDQLRSRLAQTEEDLRKARGKAGIVSVDDSMKAYTDQIARIRQEIFTAEAELAERTAAFQEIAKHPPGQPQTSNPEPDLPAAQVDEYKSVSARLELLRRREQELLTQFTEESTRVKEVRAQLADAESRKKKLEEEHPQLTRPGTLPTTTSGSSAGTFDLTTEAARVAALQSKIKVLNSQLDEIRTEAANVDQMAPALSDLRRKKELQEANYRYYSTSLEQARIAEALGAGRVSNISQIQTPSPPFRDWAKTLKLMIGVAVGGGAAGLAWAFFIELYLDRSVRRPIDFERMLGLHLFLAIPDINKSGHRRLAEAAQKQLVPPRKVERDAAPAVASREGRVPNALSEVGLTTVSAKGLAKWDPALALDPFHETLRDRLLAYFESRNLTHKPKLVAVTGLAKDAGVTTIAAGLAKCCSDTGDGNVLLVDMTAGQGSAQQFYKGKAVCGLEEILDARSSAQVQDNLFVVGEEPNSDKLSRALPKRFNQLVPKLKASDFDYIIFDMPPVSQISITPRLAGFMDMVLLVVESEKTDKDLVQKATALLAESKAHVGAVLNKTRNYVPQGLHQDNLGNI
jgi:polysaccharide biosynthesis transport protein